jgi:hypothetical protein
MLTCSLEQRSTFKSKWGAGEIAKQSVVTGILRAFYLSQPADLLFAKQLFCINIYICVLGRVMLH